MRKKRMSLVCFFVETKVQFHNSPRVCLSSVRVLSPLERGSYFSVLPDRHFYFFLFEVCGVTHTCVHGTGGQPEDTMSSLECDFKEGLVARGPKGKPCF